MGWGGRHLGGWLSEGGSSDLPGKKTARMTSITLFLSFLPPFLRALSIPGPGQARANNGWALSTLNSDRAFLHTSSPMSWAEAEDFCQTMYGHLATDDSAGELRQFIATRQLSGALWIGLHQSRPQTQFTWTNVRQKRGAGPGRRFGRARRG